MLTPFFHSLIVAFVSTCISFLITLPLSYRACFQPFRGEKLIETILLMPLVLPPTVVGLYLLKLFGKYGPLGKVLNFLNISFIFTLPGAIVATTIVLLPLLYQGLKGALKSVPLCYIEASQVLSANPKETLWKIILPTCWPSVLATLLLGFSRGLGEFGASLMVAGYIEGKTDTMATAIYFAVQEGNWQKANRLSLMMVFLGFIILLLIQFLTKQKKGLEN